MIKIIPVFILLIISLRFGGQNAAKDSLIKLVFSQIGIGWVNIQNRVEFLKGKLEITSKVGEGTSVLVIEL